MSDWVTLGSVIVAAGGLIAVLKPIFNLTTQITRLTSAIDRLEEKTAAITSNLTALTERNADTHQRIFDKLDNHEIRLVTIEHDLRKDE